MRPNSLLLMFLILAGVSVAQDTNFSIGPQYLSTVGDPMLLRPISTPSLSLSGSGLAGTSDVPTVYEIAPFASLETVTYLNNVYWGPHTSEEVVARRLEPPSMSPSDTAWYMDYVKNQFQSVPSGSSAEAATGPTVIEISGSLMPTNLPASITGLGTNGVTGSLSVRATDEYGIPLGDVAAYWKSHKRTAARVFTNHDVIRLRG
jgi:hypothetical protein